MGRFWGAEKKGKGVPDYGKGMSQVQVIVSSSTCRSTGRDVLLFVAQALGLGYISRLDAFALVSWVCSINGLWPQEAPLLL